MATVAGVAASLSLETAAFISGTQRATKAMDSFATRAAVANRDIQREFARTAATAGKMRGAIGQLGFQVQDVIVQLQAGARASTVFAQQGSQIAGAFGPAGAAVGVVIALVGALGGALFSASRDADDTTSSTAALEAAQRALTDTVAKSGGSVLELADSYTKLTAAQRDLEGLKLGEAIRKSSDEIDAQRDLIEKSISSLQEALQPGLLLPFQQFDTLGPEIIGDLQKAFDAFQAGGSAQALADTIDRYIQIFPEATDKLAEFRKTLIGSAAATADSEQRLEDYRNAIDALSSSDGLAGVNDLLAEFEQHQKAAAKATEQATREAERQADQDKRFRQRQAQRQGDELVKIAQETERRAQQAVAAQRERDARYQERKQRAQYETLAGIAEETIKRGNESIAKDAEFLSDRIGAVFDTAAVDFADRDGSFAARVRELLR